MKITNLGHASFLIEHQGVSIVFDPYHDESVPGLKFPEDVKANFIFSSHNHDDHNAIDLVEKLSTEFNIRFKDIVIPHDNKNGAIRGLNIAKIVYFDEFSVLHLGDAGDIDSIINNDEFKNIDIVLCPINGFYTISALDAIKCQKHMNWKLLIPMHFHNPLNNSGYKDVEQISLFKSHCLNTIEVNDTNIVIESNMFKFDALIFNKSKGDIN
jgi:L-ascorbate metabolism protein UlaG (beta-lactamase superfamily)